NGTLGVMLAQSTIGGIIHHEKGEVVVYTKVQHPHNMRMHQAGNNACFFEEALLVIARQSYLQHFDGGLGVEIDMFAQVDFGKASASQDANEAIVAKPLTHKISHLHLPSPSKKVGYRYLLVDSLYV